jgi:hypothetical protein
MSERTPQGGGESKEKGFESGELNLEGKSIEELEKMRDELTSKLMPETDAETASAINDEVITIEDKISELSNNKSEISEDKAGEVQEQAQSRRSKKEEVAATADEVRAMLEETSVDNYEGEEELESYGAELVNLIDWARRNKQSELVTALDKRIQGVKRKQGRGLKKSPRPRSDKNIKNKAETVQITESGNFKIGSIVNWESQGVLQFEKPTAVKGFSEDGEYAFVEGTNTGIPVKELVAGVVEDDIENLKKWQAEIDKEFASDSDSKEQSEVSTEVKLEEDIKAQEALAEAAAPEDATPEEKKGIKEALKDKWGSISKKKIMGAPLGDFTAGLVFGGGISYAARTAMRASLGFGTAALAGAIGGAGKRYVVKEFREYKFGSAEKAFDYDPGSLIDRVKKNKVSAADALTLIADWKSEMSENAKDDEIMEMLNIEDAIIKSQDSYAKLKGVDKVEAYYATVASLSNRQLISPDDQNKMLAERGEKQLEISEDIAHMSGRRVTGKEYAKAALTGAIGGLIGAEIAHLIGGFLHHDAIPTSGGSKHVDAAVEHVKSTSATSAPTEQATHAFQSKVPMPEHFEPTTQDVAPEPTEVMAPKIPNVVTPPQHVEIPHGTASHGVVVDKMNLDQSSFAAPAPHEVAVSSTPVDLNPTELALKAGINPVEYAQLGAGEMRVGEVLNSVADASQHGSLVDIGTRIGEMQPTGKEFDMTIDEFLKHRAEEAAARTAEIFKPANDQIADLVAATKTNLAHDMANLKEGLTPPVEEVAHAKSGAMQDTITAKVNAAHEATATKVNAVKEAVETKAAAAQDTIASKTEAVVTNGEVSPSTVDGSLQEVAGNIEAAQEIKKAVLPVMKTIPKDTMWNRIMSSIGLGALIGGAGAGGLAYVANKEFGKTNTLPESAEEPEDEIVEEKPEAKTPSVVAEVKQQAAEKVDTTWNKDKFAKLSPKEQRNQIFGMIRRIEPRKIFALRRQPLERLFKDGKYDNLISSLLTKWESLPDADPQRADIEHIVDAVKTISPLDNMSAYQEFRSRVANEANKRS